MVGMLVLREGGPWDGPRPWDDNVNRVGCCLWRLGEIEARPDGLFFQDVQLLLQCHVPREAGAKESRREQPSQHTTCHATTAGSNAFTEHTVCVARVCAGLLSDGLKKVQTKLTWR